MFDDEPRPNYANQAMLNQPPLFLDVLDSHHGFQAITTPGNTLWRPGSVLRRGAIGRLLNFKSDGNWQGTSVTEAYYKLPGYCFVVVCYFDNITGQRIA